MRTKIAIVGGGKGGTALLNLLVQLPEVEIIGIADKNPSAPGLAVARDRQLRIWDNPLELIQHEPTHLLIDVTGDPQMKSLIAQHKAPATEVLGGAASKLLWDLLQHQGQIESRLFQTEKLAGLGTLVSGIAHDINNPLYVIAGLAENILDEPDPAQVKDQVQHILQATKRISTICRDLTLYARRALPSGSVEVDINGQLDEALNIAQYAAELQDLEIVKDYASHPVVMAKPEEILQVFVNLLINAVHAMSKKGTLTIRSELQNGYVGAAISDTGCGIPLENRDKIFEAFFTTKPPGKGTGLGLYSVKTIVQKYGGRVLLDTEVGQGTTVRVEFPAGAHAG